MTLTNSADTADAVDLEELRPVARYRVIDLVAEVGHSVEDWSNFLGGAEKAAVNPRYCYEWCFVQEGEAIILNSWFEDMEIRQGTIVLPLNAREDIRFHSRPGGKGVWRTRAERLDAALQLAATYAVPVRVIICSGKRRERGRQDASASRVAARELDSASWAVTAYDSSTGGCVLVRGAPACDVVDQFDVDTEADSPTEVRTRTGRVFVRAEEVRRRVLHRAQGRCEYCGREGFQTSNGQKFLEIHHIVPLSQGGADSVRNAAALCPNHHREAHHGLSRKHISKKLKMVAKLGRDPAANAV